MDERRDDAEHPPTATSSQPDVKLGEEAMPSQEPESDELRRRAAKRASRALEGDAHDAGADGRE